MSHLFFFFFPKDRCGCGCARHGTLHLRKDGNFVLVVKGLGWEALRLGFGIWRRWFDGEEREMRRGEERVRGWLWLW